MLTIHPTPEFLTCLLGALLAILFDWFPGLAGWYGALSQGKKRQSMAVLLLGAVLLLFAASCAGLTVDGAGCDKAGLTTLLQNYLLAVGVNQGTHLLFKPADATGETAAQPLVPGVFEYSLFLALLALVALLGLAACRLSGA
jgi:hypothetical protein